MKKMKKYLAILLTVCMTLMMGISVFAAEPAAPTTGSITIKDAANVSVAEKTFHAYKVLDATLIDPADPSKGVAYTVPAEMAEFYAKRYSLNKADTDFGEQVAAKIAAEPDMFKFATEVLAAAKAAGITPGTAKAGDSDTSVTISNLPFGYYVVEDAGASTPISALMLDTVGTVDITLKADKPSLEKKIDGNKDTDDTTSGPVDTNGAAIGDKIPYVLTSKVPDMTGYKEYNYVVTDTFSKGLTYNNDLVITVGEKTLKDTTDYTVATDTTEAGETTLTITFKDFINYTANDTITLKYSANLNENAVIGTAGNPNTVNLEYSNNPNDAESKEKTPDDKVKTFVTELELTKTDDKGNALTGAEFEIKGTKLNTVLVTKDGKTTSITKGEKVAYKSAVGADGKLKFTGLAAGTYTITEIKAPNGYNILKNPITVVITCTLPEEISTGDETCTWEWKKDGTSMTDNNNNILFDVVNKKGTELPSTGGMGTTIFYIVGGILMIGAAVLLITRKRMSAEK